MTDAGASNLSKDRIGRNDSKLKIGEYPPDFREPVLDKRIIEKYYHLINVSLQEMYRPDTIWVFRVSQNMFQEQKNKII